MAQKSGRAQLSVSWGKCTGAKWCPLKTVDLTHDTFGAGGVYLIWYSGPESRVVRVGQAAALRDRLTAHRSDEQILAYASYGLYVTWAVLEEAHRDGVEVYLADRYKPLVGKRYPDVTPIPVNHPWS